MPMTDMQKKMKKLRDMKGKKAPKKAPKKVPKKGGCSKCPCGCKKAMCGEGRRLQAVAKAAKKAAELAKKAAALALKHRKEIAAGIGAASEVAGAITGDKRFSTVSSVAGILGAGKQRGGELENVNGTTGETQSPYTWYPNSSGLATGVLTF